MSRTTEDLLDEICSAPEAAPWLLLEAIAIARQSVEAGDSSRVRMLAGLLLIHAQMLEDCAALLEGENSAGLAWELREWRAVVSLRMHGSSPNKSSSTPLARCVTMPFPGRARRYGGGKR